jgi:integrator complex subunit 11
MVLFATPGMLHGGLSMQVFKEWCNNPKNTLIIPGYCVAGTLGNSLLAGNRKLTYLVYLDLTIKIMMFK